MRAATIDERFAGFLRNPSSASFLAVREQILAHPSYDPYAEAWTFLAEAFHQQRDANVVALCQTLCPIGLLSPRWHYFRGVAHAELGDLDTAADERQRMQSCLSTLFELGDGTPERPFLATYSWDAYDVLRALDVESHRQRLVERNHRQHDVLVGPDGDEYWFDVTEMLASARSSAVREAGSLVRP